jgi:hypothetical protein
MPACYLNEIPALGQELDFEEGLPNDDHPGKATESMGPGIHRPSISMEINVESSSDMSFYDTEPDSFAIFRSYYVQPPSFISNITLDSVCNSPHFNVPSRMKKWWLGITKSASLPSDTNITGTALRQDIISAVNNTYFQPFENPSSYHLMNWGKTLGELDRLVQDVLLKPDFNCEDLENFCANRESQRVDMIKDQVLANSLFQAADGWYKVNISLPVPFERCEYHTIADIPIFKVESLMYRRILQVLHTALQDFPPQMIFTYNHLNSTGYMTMIPTTLNASIRSCTTQMHSSMNTSPSGINTRQRRRKSLSWR